LIRLSPRLVIDHHTRVTIEGKIDPVIVHGETPDPDITPSGAELIG